jgi:hypothetical protein
MVNFLMVVSLRPLMRCLPPYPGHGRRPPELYESAGEL